MPLSVFSVPVWTMNYVVTLPSSEDWNWGKSNGKLAVTHVTCWYNLQQASTFLEGKWRIMALVHELFSGSPLSHLACGTKEEVTFFIFVSCLSTYIVLLK